MDIGIVVGIEVLKCDPQNGHRYRISERGYEMRSERLIVGIVIWNEDLKCDPQNGYRYRNWERYGHYKYYTEGET